MKLYYLRSAIDFEGELVFIKDGSKRVYHYFVLHDWPGKFLQFTKVRGRVSPPYNLVDMGRTDYLEALIPAPIFSTRARAILEAAIPDELEFHPILISVNEQEVEFHIAKTLLAYPLIDEARSTYMTLGEATILDREAYLPSFDAEFHIARDPRYPSRVRVSERFVEVCRAADLRIDFKEVTGCWPRTDHDPR